MNPRSGALGVLATVLCLLAVLTGCAGKQSTTNGSPVTDGRLTVAVEFGPKAGFAIDTDDAFVLTELGVVETLVRADPNGQGPPGLAVVTALRYVSSVAALPQGIKGVGLQAAAEGLDAVRVSTTNPDPILPLRLSRAARNTTFDASPVRALARIVVASGLTARRLARNLWGGAGGPVGRGRARASGWLQQRREASVHEPGQRSGERVEVRQSGS
jgi:hypothetical protein